MKGVLICGGTGSRLKPLTDIINKSLLPVYDQPLITFPLQTLRAAGISEIVVVTGPEHRDQIEGFLGKGDRFGCAFTFKTQEKPEGIAHALGLARDAIGDDTVCAILGDNIFFDSLTPAIAAFKKGAHIFLKEVSDPQRFGVAEVAVGTDAEGRKTCAVVSLEEKPKKPRSAYAVTGCYLYDQRCFDVIAKLAPSARGEQEITDVSAWYLQQGELSATMLEQEWIDAGTFESLFKAGQHVRRLQRATKK